MIGTSKVIDPEVIVCDWLAGEGNPPRHLATMLKRYRDLTIYRDATDDDPIELDRSMDAIFAERGISAISATGTDIPLIEQLLTGCSAI